MKLVTFSPTLMIPLIRWDGSTLCWPFCSTRLMASCKASCDLIVKFLKFIVVLLSFFLFVFCLTDFKNHSQ